MRSALNMSAHSPVLDGDQQDSAQVAALAGSQVHPESALPSIPMPNRDTSKPAEQQGLFEKFRVQRLDGSDCGGGKHDGCRYFVLDLTHDQHAPAAMHAYAESCRTTHPQLAEDIEAEFGAASLEPVEGDLLPPIGSKVQIHLGRQDAWVEHTVAGYYVWRALSHQVREGEKNAHRVFVRVRDSQGYENARLLSEVRTAAAGAEGREDGAA